MVKTLTTMGAVPTVRVQTLLWLVLPTMRVDGNDTVQKKKIGVILNMAPAQVPGNSPKHSSLRKLNQQFQVTIMQYGNILVLRMVVCIGMVQSLANGNTASLNPSRVWTHGRVTTGTHQVGSINHPSR